ncbi:MAG: hypothetical protein IJR99_16625 [Kiritimatiellae bacterium]|nr:hypothetical protein [Kiritimatiellia bacterium]
MTIPLFKRANHKQRFDRSCKLSNAFDCIRLRSVSHSATSPEANVRGAALIIVLSVLSLVTIAAVAFFTVTTQNKRTVRTQYEQFDARQELNLALWLAMKYVEDAMVVTNAESEEAVQQSESQSKESVSGRRVAPVGVWFSERHARDEKWRKEGGKEYAFQSGSFLASPSSSEQDGDYVNLLTPEVLKLLPTAVTNDLVLDPTDEHRMLSGWSWLTKPSTGLGNKYHRIAFTVVDCSGFLDANYLDSGPTDFQHSRRLFFQSDVSNWMHNAESSIRGKKTDDLIKLLEESTDLDADCPFGTLSYDPTPNVIPLGGTSNAVANTLGTAAFNTRTPKFNLNSVTNIDSWTITQYEEGNNEVSPWFNDAQFKSEWLDPVTSYINRMAGSQPPDTSYRMPEGHAIPYTLANALDSDRIPQISYFETDGDGDNAAQLLATRVDYAVEAVPLINKISIFNIFAPEGGKENPKLPEDVKFNDYDIDPTLSNHYAVAIEYWYPFTPQSPFRDSDGSELNFAAYVGIYTNENDVVTTTNRPWNSSLLRDWLRWNYTDNSETVLQTFFNTWKNAYLDEVGPSVYSNPLWLAANFQQDLWFTSSMTNHAYWPSADTNGMFAPYVEQFFTPLGLEQWPIVDTNGTFDITQTPMWLAFHPATTNIVELETNLVWVVTESNELENVITTNALVEGHEAEIAITNLFWEETASNLVEQVVTVTNEYTYLTVTNPIITWLPDEENSYRLRYAENPSKDHPATWTLWEAEDGSFLTNDVISLTDVFGTEIPFTSTNQFSEFWLDETNQVLVTVTAVEHSVTNEDETVETTYEMVTNVVIGLTLQETGTTNEWYLTTNSIMTATEVQRVKPLPMSLEMGLVLDELFYLLPTNSPDALYMALMATPEDDLNWDDLLRVFSQFPRQMNKVFPSLQEPTLGNLTDKDRFYLREGTDNGNEDGGLNVFDDTRVRADKDFQGYFWTVYPKQTVNFMVVEEIKDPANESTVIEVVTNYYALGDPKFPGDTKPTIWVRPVTTVLPNGSDYDQDQIVDEALLTSDGLKVLGFTSVTNLYAPDPRRNAHYTQWRGFPTELDWTGESIRSTNLTAVCELPFILTDRPMEKIGEIGNLFASYLASNKPEEEEEGKRDRYDTITFSTRAGASLLDVFTVAPTNNPPIRGLVQANTPHNAVVQALLADVHPGWTNAWDGIAAENESGTMPTFETDKTLRENWSQVYREALTNRLDNAGWRCFADMMPELLTNRYNEASDHANQMKDPWLNANAQLHPMHDYDEDVAAALIDKLSFRQNVLTVIVAAQTLATGSTPAHPVVLSEQRAAATILRDAYTGRWAITSWRTLSAQE